MCSSDLDTAMRKILENTECLRIRSDSGRVRSGPIYMAAEETVSGVHTDSGYVPDLPTIIKLAELIRHANMALEDPTPPPGPRYGKAALPVSPWNSHVPPSLQLSGSVADYVDNDPWWVQIGG